MNTSSNYEWLQAVFYALAPQIPLYLIYLVGIIVALVYLKRHPRVSFLTIISIGISLLAGIIVTVVQVLLPSYLIRQGSSAQSLGYYFFGLGIISNLIHVVTFGLLLIAIFTGRSARPNFPPPAPQQFE